MCQNASDSDPDGDILDMKERIQTCCKNNVNLKKKISENLKKTKQNGKDTKKVRKNSIISSALNNDDDYLIST